MSRRQSIYIDGFAHVNPIPAACRIDNIVYSGVVSGMEPDTGEIAEGLERQCELVFKHIGDIVAKAGGSMEDVIKLSVSMQDSSQRDVLNAQWRSAFPDSDARPARHTEQADLKGAKLIQAEFVAVLPS